MRAQARREADVIVAEARSAPATSSAGAESERERIHTEIRRLQHVETDVRADYRAFLLAALDRLESDTEERQSAASGRLSRPPEHPDILSRWRAGMAHA